MHNGTLYLFRILLSTSGIYIVSYGQMWVKAMIKILKICGTFFAVLCGGIFAIVGLAGNIRVDMDLEWLTDIWLVVTAAASGFMTGKQYPSRFPLAGSILGMLLAIVANCCFMLLFPGLMAWPLALFLAGAALLICIFSAFAGAVAVRVGEIRRRRMAEEAQQPG